MKISQEIKQSDFLAHASVAGAGALVLEDQDGNVVSLWTADMQSFDELPKSIRAYMHEMVSPPLASSVLASYRQFGYAPTMHALREIELNDRIAYRGKQS